MVAEESYARPEYPFEKYRLDPTKQVGGVPPVATEDALVVLLYLLMRDHLATGVFEELTREMAKAPPGAILTNPFLAHYAENIALRLRMVTPPTHMHDEEQEGIEACMSIANLVAQSYEYYGGVDVRRAVAAARRAVERLGGNRIHPDAVFDGFDGDDD